MNKTLKVLSGVLANVFAVCLGVTYFASAAMYENEGNINALLNIETQQVVQDTTASDDQDSMYWKSDYSSIKELRQNSENIVARVVEEGAVLLKNENNALPLRSNAAVSLFSTSSVNFIYSGGGSSFSSSRDKEAENGGHPIAYDLKTALESEGFTVNPGLWQFYGENAEQYLVWQTSTTGSNRAVYTINEAPWSALPESKNDRAEAAIFVLSRYGTEGTDVPLNTPDKGLTNGNYLELTPEEKDVLQNIKAQKDAGVFDKVIVLMNAAAQVQCDFVDDPSYGIDALLWIGTPGSSGNYGVARLLSGKVAPSGRLTDTFWAKHYYNPILANWGATPYINGENMPGGVKSQSYVVYQEGIYNGYRYTETRYEDVVMGTGNAGDFDYNQVVTYPFGYGLSYTTFSYSNFNADYNALQDVYTITVDVTSNGTVAAKEVVQIYLQKPYTNYDRMNGIEKAAVELVGFSKTDVIPAGKTAQVVVEVAGNLLASYDAYAAKTYILDAGNYYFTAAQNAHEAINNILAAKGKSTADGMTAEGDSSLTAVFSKEFDAQKYAVSPYTGAAITNQFDNANPNLYFGDNTVTFVSRNDWEGTLKFGFTQDGTYLPLNNTVILTATEQLIADAQPKVPQPDEALYPAYGVNNGLTLADLLAVQYDENGQITEFKAVDYDNPLWQALLDQLTWEETVTIVSNGLRSTAAINSVAKPATMDMNGAIGPVEIYGSNKSIGVNRYTFLYNDPDAYTQPPQYPCNELVAATYNVDLVEEMGKQMGEDCLWSGYAGLYGPGANLHRGAYNGRLFEYYSEDGLLSGRITAAEVRGIQSKGVYVYMKHAILNNMEANREGVGTWVDEQTIRELYLKPFEYAIGEGGAYNVMTGFNRIGAVWTSAHGYVNTVLRNEFGMNGFAVSDYWQRGYMTMAGSLLGGGDLPDGSSKEELNAYASGYGGFAQIMRESAHRILYTVAGSNAVNGMTTNTRILTITPWWQPTLTTLLSTFAVLLVLSTAVCFVETVKDLKEKKRD